MNDLALSRSADNPNVGYLNLLQDEWNAQTFSQATRPLSLHLHTSAAPRAQAIRAAFATHDANPFAEARSLPDRHAEAILDLNSEPEIPALIRA